MRYAAFILGIAGLIAVLVCLRFAAPALAASVTTVSNDDTGARTLAESMVRDAGQLRGASFVTVPPSGTPHGVSDSLSFFPTDGDKFGIMTTGNANFAPTENTQTNSGEDLGGTGSAERGNSAYDVSVLKLDLTAPADANCLKFDFAFYSEEYYEYVNTQYNDTFIAELDKTSWTTNSAEIVAPDNFAFDTKNAVVSINSTGNTGMNDINASGTTYDGATVLLEAAQEVTPGDHSLYLSVLDQADHAYDSAAFVDKVRFINVANPETDCRPGARPIEEVERTPLILVPGIAGTELRNSATGEEMWPRVTDLATPGDDAFLRDIKLDRYGNDIPGQEAEAGEILATVAGSDRYDTTIKTLENNGYTLNKDLFIFPYDWRKDTRSAPGGNFPDGEDKSLLQFIDHVREQSRLSDDTLPQVDIVAHSQGGLVTLSALQDQDSSSKVRKVLTLGTPVLGATKALGVLQYQMPCFVEPKPYLCLSHPPTVQEIFDTFPGAHQLLPSPNFDEAVGAPLVIDRTNREDGRTGEQGYDGWSAILHADPKRNNDLLEDAKLFHQQQDQIALADPSVQLTRVVGSGIDTPKQIREYNLSRCSYVGAGSLYCFDTVEHEIVKGGGDGTVNENSADLYGPEKLFDMRGQNDFGTIPNVYAPDVTHEDLPLDERVLGFANAYFGNASSGPQAQSFGAQSLEPKARAEADPRTVSTADFDAFASGTEDLAAGFGLSDAPQPVEGREIEIVGPAAGYVEDTQGRILGHDPSQPAGVISQDIPGGTYQAINDTRTFFLNEDDGTFGSDFKKTGEEDLRLRVRDYASDEISGQAVFEIEAPVDAKVSVNFSSAQALGDLRVAIDENGDGTVDKEQAPESVVTGPASSEVNPPKTTAKIETANAGQYTVTLAADDGPDGSGVAETRYFIEGEQSEATYSGSFTIPEGTRVQYWSVDKAGNAEQAKEVVANADALAPDTNIASGPSGPTKPDNVSFTFSSSKTNTSFECALDGAPFAACTSPKSYPSLAEGAHTFEVRAIDINSGPDASPAKRSFSVDATAPTVSSVAPAAGANTVAPSANIIAGFSENMNASTLNTDTFQLVKSGSATPVSATVTYDPATKKATLNPSANLVANVTYTATLKGGTNGVRDVAGNPVAVNKSWSFYVNTAPVITNLSFNGVTSSCVFDRTPTIRATIRDAQSNLLKGNIRLYLDGVERTAFTYDSALDRLTFTPDSALAFGNHSLKITARDPQGLLTTKNSSLYIARSGERCLS